MKNQNAVICLFSWDYLIKVHSFWNYLSNSDKEISDSFNWIQCCFNILILCVLYCQFSFNDSFFVVFDFDQKLNCSVVTVYDIFHFLMWEDSCCHFEIDVSVINEEFEIAAYFVINRWDCFLNVFNQLLNFMLLKIVCSQLVFIYSESCCVGLLICSCQMCKFNRFWLMNSWLRVFCNYSLRISSLWLRACYDSCCSCRCEREKFNIWFNRLLNLNFVILNNFSNICSHCHQLKFFFSWFSVCWSVQLDFINEHCWKSMLVQNLI